MLTHVAQSVSHVLYHMITQFSIPPTSMSLRHTGQVELFTFHSEMQLSQKACLTARSRHWHTSPSNAFNTGSPRRYRSARPSKSNTVQMIQYALTQASRTPSYPWAVFLCPPAAMKIISLRCGGSPYLQLPLAALSCYFTVRLQVDAERRGKAAISSPGVVLHVFDGDNPGVSRGIVPHLPNLPGSSNQLGWVSLFCNFRKCSEIVLHV